MGSPRFPCTTGVAGEVLRTGEAVLVADLSHDPRFARDIAIAAGYEPDALAGLEVDGNAISIRSLGVVT